MTASPWRTGSHSGCCNRFNPWPVSEFKARLGRIESIQNGFWTPNDRCWFFRVFRAFRGLLLFHA